MMVPPLPTAEASQEALEKAPAIAAIPKLDPIPDALEVAVLLKIGSDISTDDIMPAGARVRPWCSNIPRTSEFTFEPVDETYPARATAAGKEGHGHAIVAGNNYGQGSSRENAALAPRYLGLRIVLARSFARIHWQNLVNFGVLPLTFADPADYDRIGRDDMLSLTGIHAAQRAGPDITAGLTSSARTIALHHTLSARQLDLLLAGGVINWLRERLVAA